MALGITNKTAGNNINKEKILLIATIVAGVCNAVIQIYGTENNSLQQSRSTDTEEPR